MTREEEIITACKAFLSRYPNIDQAGLSIGFLDGAVWSDKHPKKTMEKSLNTLYCSKCGGTNIQAQSWVDPNTKEFINYVNGPFLETDDCWCDDCEDNVRLCTIQELWNMFAYVPINNDDKIENDFLCFKAGTSRLDVWHWFNERCPNGLAVDLMGKTSKQNTVQK